MLFVTLPLVPAFAQLAQEIMMLALPLLHFVPRMPKSVLMVPTQLQVLATPPSVMLPMEPLAQMHLCIVTKVSALNKLALLTPNVPEMLPLTLLELYCVTLQLDTVSLAPST